MIVSVGRPGLSRPQLAFLKNGSARRHVVVAQGPGRWADPQRAATDVATALRLTGTPDGAGSAGGWLDGWQRADEAARRARWTPCSGLEDESLTRAAARPGPGHLADPDQKAVVRIKPVSLKQGG